MIPNFPEFKQLEWNDRKEFETFSLCLAPHSDFNFISIWTWDLDGTVKFSKLNDNLIILVNDYLNNGHFLSFIGKNILTKTTLELINYSIEKYNVSILKYIPEEIANNINNTGLIVEVDECNCDHICFVSDFTESDKLTAKSGKTGQNCRQFLKLYPQCQTKISIINNVEINESKGLFKIWAINNKEDYLILNEYKAFERFLHLKEDNLKVILVYIDDVLIGFQTIEILLNDFAMCEFVKADIKYRGIYTFLMWKTCQYLKNCEISYLNMQVDMGNIELRNSKLKNYKSKMYLNRYTIKKM